MAMGALLFIFFLFQTAFPVLGEKCPEPEDISPCKCEVWPVDVVCKSASLTDLENAFRQLQGIEMRSVILEGLKFETIPSNLFQGLHIIDLYIIHSYLQGVSDSDGKPAFVGLEDSLQSLQIYNSLKEEVRLTSLNLTHLNKLKRLQLTSINIPELDNSWFKDGPYSLLELNLQSCNIKKFGDRAFESLVNLQDLIIYDSYFHSFRRTMISNPAKKLVNIGLGGNNISSLPEDAFLGMPALQYVFLKNNSITRLPAATWSPVWEQVFALDLTDNPLQCDSEIAWMFSIKRPVNLFGTCTSPNNVKNIPLNRLIDSNKE